MGAHDELKSERRKSLERFFGYDLKMVNGSYFRFRRVISEDEIILITKKVRKVKEKYVLFIAKNKGVYLQDWQVRQVSSYEYGFNAYAVRLTRKYFKPYIFEFEAAGIRKGEDTFDSLLELAREQEKEDVKVREGHIRDI